MGQVLKGDVVRIADFGAFIDIGGVDGLLPLSQISWRWVDHPGDILKVGDKIKGKDYISLMRIKKDYGDASSKEAERLGYKTTGNLAYSGSKLKKSKPAQRKVTGVESKTVGKPSTSTTTTKIKYKRRK